MTVQSPLSEEFLRRAQKYSGGHVHLLIDGSNVATEGYMFKENDPPGLLLETAMNLKIAMPHTGFSATYWAGDKAKVAVDLFRPSTWHKLIPKGRAQINPALEQTVREITDGTLKTPLHLIAFTNMGMSDSGDAMQSFAKLREMEGVSIDVIILTDSMKNGYRAVRAVSDLNPLKPIRDFVILEPEELETAIRASVTSATDKIMQAREDAEMGGRIYTAEGVSAALHKGTAKGATAPVTAHFKRKN